MNNRLLDEIIRIKAIADTGLLYADNEFDKERYAALRDASFRLMSEISEHPVDTIRDHFPLVMDYPTAKVDIRGLLLAPDKKILLVKESMDGRWSLPGGWADVGYSPKENITREFKEETGLTVIPEKLLAVFDKKMHPHPPQPFYTYKMVFYCRPLTSVMEKGFDVLDVQYFDIAHLPDLSEDRILKSQLDLLLEKIKRADFTTYVD